jgi:hypothetical protein
MERIDKNKELDPKKLDFLLEVEFLMKQMENAHIPLDEGYDKLIKLFSRHHHTQPP